MSCGEPAAGRFWHSPGHEGKREHDEAQGHEPAKGHDDGGRAQEGEHVADGARGQGSNRSSPPTACITPAAPTASSTAIRSPPTGTR